ncbi:MAG: prepilin peptidase [Lachnospiraceae bacterium]|nr:prepilin peptidase [Lachnospiraceae bacterium]
MLIMTAATGLMLVTSIRDIRKREIARWMFAAAGVLSTAAVIIEIAGSADTGLTAGRTILSLLPGIILLALGFLSKGGIGYGDGIFALLLGPVFGLERMATGICLAFFLSAVFSVILLVRKRVGRDSSLPFIPFFAAAMGVMLCVFR